MSPCIYGTALLLILSSLAAAQSTKPAPVKAGAYYFDGWTGQTFHITERLKTEFFDREPVWGWRDDSAAVMQQQIDAAADGGLAFWAFDWYWPEGEKKETPLNNALSLYLAAPNRDRLQFCLLVANHAGFRIGPADWETVCNQWVELFKKPGHLTVDKNPLLIFFSPRELRKAFGEGQVKPALQALREKARAAGLKGVSVAACCTPGPQNNWDDLSLLAEEGYDLFTGYNYPGYKMHTPAKLQPFADLVDGHVDIWERFAVSAQRPYIPVITVGWDNRPWEPADQPPKKPYYPDRTVTQLRDFVAKGVAWINAHPDKTVAERILLLYAWNENGEGGYLTPTKAYGDAWMTAVREGLAGGK